MENGTFDLEITDSGVLSEMTLVVRDSATKVERLRLHVDTNTFALAVFGKTHRRNQPCQFNIPEQSKLPLKPITKEALVEIPVLPPLGAPMREKMINDILRPYEVEGWKADRRGIDDKNRVARTLPDGTFLVNMVFTKHVVDQAAVDALKSAD